MRNLFLLRHAKSSWKDTLIDDFKRPLNNRGKRDAPQMAYKFSKRDFGVDLIISSSAKRTSDTAKIFADILCFKSEIVYKKELYEASHYEILEVINHTNEKFRSVLIVCHNPGVTSLVNYLSDHYIDNLPTSGIVGLSTDLNWKEIKQNSCSFLFIDYPKK
jgi:phosphohistidine phosphatase